MLPSVASPPLCSRFATAPSEPGIDTNEGISDATVTRENGRTIMDFTRPMVSTDRQDISLNQCVFFLYAARGGAVNDFNSRSIAYHDQTPLVSPAQVCLPQPGQCTGGPGVHRHRTAHYIHVVYRVLMAYTYVLSSQSLHFVQFFQLLPHACVVTHCLC